MIKGYRPELDILRSIAVISVIIYHLDIKIFGYTFLSGGYLGVDIFFVLSGYLIIKIMFQDFKKKNFSFAYFFERRARRILPVMLVVLLFSLIVGWFLLLPSNYINLAQSNIFSILLSSNIYFWNTTSSYGAIDNIYVPLLHLWSLAVEMQFYIFISIFLFLILRFLNKKVIFILVFIFLLNLLFIQLSGNLSGNFPFFEKEFKFNSPSTFFNFYFFSSRLWEFLAGGFIFVIETKKKTLILSKFFYYFGLILIFLSLFFFNKDLIVTRNYYDDVIKLFHPSIVTIFPVLGTCLVILTSKLNNINNFFITNKILIFLGLISYSLYMWHYPIISYYHYFKSNITFIDKIFIIIIVFFISLLSYHYLENFFRNKSLPLKKFIIYMVIFISINIFFSYLIINNNGFKSRINENKIHKNYEVDNSTLWKERSTFDSENQPVFREDKKIKILFFGDSHARDMFNVFYLNKDQFKNFAFAKAEEPLGNKDYFNNIIKNENFKRSDYIILSWRWSLSQVLNIENLIKFLNKNKKKIIILSRSNEYQTFRGGSQTILDWHVSTLKEDFVYESLKNKYYLMRKLEEYEHINNKLKKISEKYNIPFLNKNDFLCSDILLECDYITDDGHKIFHDSSHYTLNGAKYFGQKIKKNNWFNINH